MMSKGEEKGPIPEVRWRNPVPNEDGTFDVEIDHPSLGWVAFTASKDDVEPHGVDIFTAVKAFVEVEG